MHDPHLIYILADLPWDILAIYTFDAVLIISFIYAMAKIELFK